VSTADHIPPDLWEECPGCHQLLYSKELVNELWVCSKCGFHKRLSVWQRLEVTVDPGSFEETEVDLPLTDPLDFPEYRSKLEQARAKTKMNEAVLTGDATIHGIPLGIGLMDLAFIGGSMGWVVGEKIARLMERCIEQEKAAVVFSASGGARMQESLISLMQMPKTSGAVAKLGEAGLPYISVLTNPTYGGVTASFAFLGDVILAEKGAAMGFAGPRVIEVMKMNIKPSVQTAEFQYEHGMIDLLVERGEMRDTLADLLSWFQSN
jgi:acetyl-CoA carboxylase carboxyl transferase subunit beta